VRLICNDPLISSLSLPRLIQGRSLGKALSGPLKIDISWLLQSPNFLHGWDVLSLRIKRWFWSSWSTLIGGLALTVMPEWDWEKYAKRAC